VKEFNSNNYVIEVMSSMRDVSAQDWDALLDAQTEPTPFMRHAYLSAMEENGLEIAACHPSPCLANEGRPFGWCCCFVH
jgi:predicted N-acyltransferase